MERLALGREYVPTSAAQRRLWILQKLEPESAASNRPLGLRLKGELDPIQLEASLNEIVRRHEALRTVFPERDGEPLQHVVPDLSVSVEIRSLDILPIHARESEAQRIAIEEANKPFNLTTGPLIRAVLLRLASEEHLLLVLMHHIVFDGWSENVFIHEFHALYNACVNGKESPLPEPPLQYADFALWQNQRLEERVDQELLYWKDQLSGIPTMLQLSTDYPRTQRLASHGATWSMVLDASLTRQLKHLSRRENVTLFMTLLSGFQLLLSRHAGQDDILVGVPVVGRTLPQVEELIGCFMNILVMRTSLSGNPSFVELLKRVRETALQAYARQETPFEKLVEELHPARQISRWPLFQVMFNLRNLPNSQVPWADGIQLKPYAIRRGAIGGLDLSLEVRDSGEHLCCTFNYAQELFRRQTIERMGRSFHTLLQAAVLTSHSPISRLLFLPEKERHRILDEWNQTEKEYPGNRCIQQLFESQVRQRPQAVAVVFEGQSITYLQLNEKANQLARYLRILGVTAESAVGILMDRSLDLVISLLGILKAGAAYVPLDPAYPPNRLAFMLEDSQAQIVVTQEQLVPSLSETRVQTLCLGTDWPRMSCLPCQDLDAAVTADNLAYVMYTSGSTGRPKAVMINHRSVLNYLLWRSDYFPLAESDRVLQKAPLSFDDSVWEIFEPLMVGARIVMARPGGHTDSRYLAHLIIEHQVTAACFVPSLLQAFLDEPESTNCKSLRRVTTGGEALSIELQERFFERLGADLHNGYGPTEATIGASFWTCDRKPGQWAVPIGRPIANTQIYLLDTQLDPVPVGVPGELCIGGSCLARGYLNNPYLTAAKFIPNAFTQTAGERLFRTGDLARYRPDGNLEFLGRIDDQVKIRGVRIEPGEVQAAIRQHPAVERALVLVREDPQGVKRLVAYLVASSEKPTDVREFRQFLSRRLPDYMIPAAFVFMDSLPFTVSGKVDRERLQSPNWNQLGKQINFVAPRNPLEVRLGELWGKLLGLERVGIHDNFFEIGGHSLSATQFLSRVKAAFQLDLPLRTLFEKPTIGELALVITEKLSKLVTPHDLDSLLANVEGKTEQDLR